MRSIRCFSEMTGDINEVISLNAEESLHIAKVLRLRENDSVQLLDGKGNISDCLIKHVELFKHQAQIDIKIIDKKHLPEPYLKVHLFIAMPKGKLMTQIIRDATEIGVWKITPILCRYSVVDLSEKNTEPIWRLHASEACKQSGNPYLPLFSPTIKFQDAINQAPLQGYLGAVPEIKNKKTTNDFPLSGDIALWIGPEGGFSKEEHEILLNKGYIPLTAGQWVLRVETAVTALLGIINQQK